MVKCFILVCFLFWGAGCDPWSANLHPDVLMWQNQRWGAQQKKYPAFAEVSGSRVRVSVRIGECFRQFLRVVLIEKGKGELGCHEESGTALPSENPKIVPLYQLS